MHTGYAPASAEAPYFFLSFAHRLDSDARDAADPHVWMREFFNDLSQSVAQLAGLPHGQIPGFMDDGSPPMRDSSARMQKLATCRVFVPVWSKRYFASENCGREWSYFTRRARGGTGDARAASKVIVPISWHPVEQRELPPAVQSVQLSYAGNKAYQELGLYGIMKLSRFRGDYLEVVYDLARRIVAAAGRSVLREGTSASFETLHNAFGERPVAAGERVLRISVVAPRRDELPDVRQDASFYGRSPRDWDPYAPHSDGPIAEYAAGVALSLGFEPEVRQFDQREAEARLRDGSRPALPEVLIVDPWVLLAPHYKHLLECLDKEKRPWVQVIVAWNEKDGESQEHTDKLRAKLEAALPCKLAEVSSAFPVAAEGVPSLNEFGHVLPRLMNAAARQYLRHAQAFPPAGPAVSGHGWGRLAATPG